MLMLDIVHCRVSIGIGVMIGHNRPLHKLTVLDLAQNAEARNGIEAKLRITLILSVKNFKSNKKSNINNSCNKICTHVLREFYNRFLRFWFKNYSCARIMIQ